MNNVFQLAQALKNPQAFIQQAMNNNQYMQNPMAKNALEMYQSGNIDGVKAMAENLAKERHTTVDEVKNSLLSQIGMN